MKPPECVQHTSSQAPAADCSLISFWGTHRASLSNGTPIAATFCETRQMLDGSPALMFTKATYGSLTLGLGALEWIASQRASLARTFQRQVAASASMESEADCGAKSSAQLTLFDLDSCSSKIAPGSVPEGAKSLSANSWRVDIPGKTERLKPLMSAQAITAIVGGAYLPTLTVCGNWNAKGASKESGDGLVTALKKLPTLLVSDATSGAGFLGVNRSPRIAMALKMLPTLCATDYKSPYSAAGYLSQAQKRSKPLRDTLAHTTGHRLSVEVAEWYMGFPLNHTASRRWAMRKSRFKRPQRGGC